MLLSIDKPKGLTSHDVVDIVRKVTGERRVGHAGTLDPNATGLLLVGVGREETKKLGSLTKDTPKIYEAEIVLGEERTTDDIEGEVVKSNKSIHPDKEDVKRVLKEFNGIIEQIPPTYSAVKVGGKKSYMAARKGQLLDLKSRVIEIYSTRLIEYIYPVLKVDFEVSSGTYIRSLARDIGRKLGTYAYLANLRRTKIGEFSVEKALSLQQLRQMHLKGQMPPKHL